MRHGIWILATTVSGTPLVYLITNHMDGDESIPPSDAEEMEEVEASRTQYWESVTSIIKHNLATLWANSSGEGTPARSAASSGERAMVTSPPRKRRKVSACRCCLWVPTYLLWSAFSS